jgi:hypothetical protein
MLCCSFCNQLCTINFVIQASACTSFTVSMINKALEADQIRQQQLETWYDQDGRHDPSHPWHATYTGLALQYANSQQLHESPIEP